MPELLLELLSEEIPARMQTRAAADLKRLVCDGLKSAGLEFSSAEAYATPRRLALVVDGIPDRQPDVSEERKGPQVGAPEKAVEGFLKSVGLESLDQCEQRDIKGKTFYFAVMEKKGGATKDILNERLGDIVWHFPWPKSMKWGEDSLLKWVRPIRQILCLFGGETIEMGLAGGVGMGGADMRPMDDAGHALEASNTTSGHRFLSPGAIEVRDFADYRRKLNDAHVILEPARRRALIETEAKALAVDAGLTLRDDPGLLDEVTGLVEWPVVMIGDIDAAFMDLPDEVLVTSMRHHQKYFSCLDGAGKLAPKFIVVAGTEAADGGAAIIAGNQRVLRARLADAKFFWDTDRKKKLNEFLAALQGRVFHARLGSVAEKVTRMGKLAAVLAKSIPGCDSRAASRAAAFAKADLSSEMVGEFPELQGVMGRYYALADGEKPEIADAIADHYAPAGPNDACPSAPISVAAALADKIDSLTGFFTIDEKPTGSKDPFALRRAALGVIRLVLENDLRLSLLEAFKAAGAETAVAEDLLAFFADRLKVHLKDQGVRHDLIDAVFALGDDDLVRVLARVGGLSDFLATRDGANLLTAYKRAANILRIEEKKDNKTYAAKTDAKLLEESQEKDLDAALSDAVAEIDWALKAEDFAAAMTALSKLRVPVDTFFDRVTVNAEDAKLRANRLNILARIRDGMNRVADFSRIEGGER